MTVLPLFRNKYHALRVASQLYAPIAPFIPINRPPYYTIFPLLHHNFPKERLIIAEREREEEVGVLKSRERERDVVVLREKNLWLIYANEAKIVDKIRRICWVDNWSRLWLWAGLISYWVLPISAALLPAFLFSCFIIPHN